MTDDATIDRVTTKTPLGKYVGRARQEMDLSLHYASYLNLQKGFTYKELIPNGKGTGICYHFANGGSVELKREITSIGDIVVYFHNCPKSIYEGLNSLSANIVNAVNRDNN